MAKIEQKTTLQRKREARNLAIYNEYNELISREGQSKTVVNEYLMKKYGISSIGTLYVIRKTVGQTLKTKKEE